MTRVKRLGRDTFASLHNRNYRLYFVGQTISVSGTWMQGIAQAWLILKLTGQQRHRARHRHRVAVPPDAALRRVGRRARRPVRQAPAAVRHPDRRRIARARARRHRHRGRSRGLERLPPVVPARLRQHGRQPGAADVRARDGRARPAAERGEPEQRRHELGARRRPGHRRRADRPLRRRSVLLHQRRVVRRQ